MSFLKKRGTAITILAAVTVISLFFGFWRSFQKASDNVEKLFYTGVYNSEQKYKMPALESLLTDRYNAAGGMVATCSSYPELEGLTDELRNAKNALYDASSIGEKYSANLSVESAYKALYEAFLKTDASSGDISAVEDYVSSLSGAQSAIESAGYNEKVDEFMSGAWSAFPARYLRGITGTTPPEYFR